jgi:hypothetical protein
MLCQIGYPSGPARSRPPSAPTKPAQAPDCHMGGKARTIGGPWKDFVGSGNNLSTSALTQCAMSRTAWLIRRPIKAFPNVILSRRSFCEVEVLKHHHLSCDWRRVLEGEGEHAILIDFCMCKNRDIGGWLVRLRRHKYCPCPLRSLCLVLKDLFNSQFSRVCLRR